MRKQEEKPAASAILPPASTVSSLKLNARPNPFLDGRSRVKSIRELLSEEPERVISLHKKLSSLRWLDAQNFPLDVSSHSSLVHLVRNEELSSDARQHSQIVRAMEQFGLLPPSHEVNRHSHSSNPTPSTPNASASATESKSVVAVSSEFCYVEMCCGKGKMARHLQESLDFLQTPSDFRLVDRMVQCVFDLICLSNMSF
jgi:hypothetical protein